MNEARVVPTRSISALSRRNLNAGGTVQRLRIEDNPRSVPNIQEPVRRAIVVASNLRLETSRHPAPTLSRIIAIGHRNRTIFVMLNIKKCCILGRTVLIADILNFGTP
jgi:hypothetical protein